MAAEEEPPTDSARLCAHHIAPAFVARTTAELRAKLKDRALDRRLWARIRRYFEIEIAGLPDSEFTKTFFSSITRRLFGTIGVDADIEFVATDLDPLAGISAIAGTNTYA